MKVHVNLFSRFREHLPPEARGEATIEFPDGASLQNLLDHLDIHRPVKLLIVNGERELDRDRILCDGDAVRIYPIVVGG